MESENKQPLAERNVLALMIADDRFRRRGFGEGLGTDHFRSYSAVFQGLQALHRAGDHVDAATVAHAARPFALAEDDPEPSDQIEAIMSAGPTADGWTWWVDVLRKSLALRIVRDGGSWFSSISDADEAVSASESVLEALQQALTGPSKASGIREASEAFMEHLEEVAQRGESPGIRTGIDQLDAISGGIKPGELWTVLAKTSRGKTALMLQIAANVAAQGGKVAVFSAEMMKHELVARLVSNVGSVDLQRVLDPSQCRQGEKQIIGSAVQQLAGRKLWIDDTPRMSMAHIEAEAQRLHDAHDGIDLVVVDYIQIIKGERQRNESREQEVARISGALKQLAKQLGCPVATAAQLNRNGETRESDAISFDSDAMLFIGDNGVKVGKLRNGQRDGLLPLILDGEKQRFITNSTDTNQPDDGIGF